MSISLARPYLKALVLAGQTPPWALKHKRSKYIITVALSTPPWVNKTELMMLQEFARAMTIFHGSLWTCDHIVPVTHPNICGLSVPWNFQIIPWRVNARKGNKWNPDQLDLFEPTPTSSCDSSAAPLSLEPTPVAGFGKVSLHDAIQQYVSESMANCEP